MAEVFGWHATLEAKPDEAAGFYSIIAAATLIGFTGIDSIHMLVWSAVPNGIVAVPIRTQLHNVIGATRRGICVNRPIPPCCLD
ncbi:Mn2+/Fe2+ NRAMP family transporter [Bradyrhizobium sp. USDA 4369]